MKKINTMKNIFIIFCFVLGVVSTKGQNLIPNPSFEVYDTCPYIYGNQIYFATPWFQPRTYFGNVTNSSSSDYYNSCSTIMNVPNGPEGFQFARTGSAYAGIFFYAYNGTREYLEVELNDSMIAGNLYCVEYYVSLGYPYDKATDNYHFYFSSDSLLDNNSIYSPINVTPSVTNLLGNFVTDTLNWTKISGNYVASGGEKFLTIGNFYDNANTDTIGSTGSSIYCFIDDVSVVTCGIAGLNENPNPTAPKIYPNPTSGIVYIDFKGSDKFIISVFNSLGQRISSRFRETNSGMELNLIEENNGIYNLQIESNKTTFYKKIILIK